jgi:hypothetical protein
MRRRVIAPGAAIVQIHVQLREVEPAVWRRIQIPAAATMADLHEVLQAALGWTNSHLHEFQIGADRIGVPDPEWDEDDEVRDEALVLVGEAAVPGARLHYVYDFGELIAVAQSDVRYPRCLDGAGPCPPENVGGPGGTRTSSLSSVIPHMRTTSTGWPGVTASTPTTSRSPRPIGNWSGSRGRTQCPALSLFPTMRLSRVQDLGGCRAVMTDIGAVRELADHYHHAGFRHRLARFDDYIESPKPSGYRGMHLVFKYSSDRVPVYNGLQIEIQLRTRKQHSWATAVETVSMFTSQALKSSRGEEEWLRFFSVDEQRSGDRRGCPDGPWDCRKSIGFAT